MDPLAELFDRYAARGDVGALGEVFDRAAPKLLHLAMHLASSAEDAEDLLQATFVLAMRKGTAFDRAQPLLPWLCGMLAGEAKNLARRNQHRRTEALPELVDAESGPIACAERRELVAQLRAHVEALPGEQRQALLLQLQHGLSPTAIAEVLDVPPGTIRMRLHRGLSALRRLLPSGLALWLFGALPARGLAAVRASVLREGALCKSVAGGAAIAAGVVSMKYAVGAVAAVLAAVLCWWFATPADPTPPRRGNDVAQGAPIAAAEQRRPEPAQPATSAVPERERDPEVEREVAPVPPRAEENAPAAKILFTRTVRGRVLHADSMPAAGAGVRAGRSTATAAADGTFALDVQSPDDDLAAWLAGHEPVVVPDVAQLPDVIAGRTIDVVLPGAALTIDGRLVAADGSPAKGWRLHLHGGVTVADDSGIPALSAEDFAAGAAMVRDRRAMSGPKSNPNERAIGDDGAFVFGGLRRNRDYVLRAWNEKTLQTALSPPLRAGTRGYTFVVPLASFREHVRGRAIDRHGGPIAGVRVRLTMRVHKSGAGESYETGQAVQTDADGRFAFVQVVREDLLLRFDGEHVVTAYHEFRANDPGDDLLVPLGTLCRWRFEPSPFTAQPTSLRVLDAQQQALQLTRRVEPGHSQSGTRLEWKDGDAAREISVSDEAAWLVVEQDGREVRRTPMRLLRGEVTIVRG